MAGLSGQDQGETFRMMKIVPFRRVVQRPVAECIAAFDDGGKTDAQRLLATVRWQGIRGEKGTQHEASGREIADNDGRGERQDGFFSLPIGAESIGRPLAGRRKIEFPVGGFTLYGNESLETGMLPEAVTARIVMSRWNQQLRWIAAQLIDEAQCSVGKASGVRNERQKRHCRTGRMIV